MRQRDILRLSVTNVPIYLASLILYADSDMQQMGSLFAIDRTEASIAAFALVRKVEILLVRLSGTVGVRCMVLVGSKSLIGLGEDLLASSPIKGSPQCTWLTQRPRLSVNRAVDDCQWGLSGEKPPTPNGEVIHPAILFYFC